MSSKFTPNQPQAGRYWPGKPLRQDEESSSEEESEYEEEQQQAEKQVGPAKAEPVAQAKQDGRAASKLVTTMKYTGISETGPYMPPAEESSEEDSEDQEEDVPASQPSSKVQQAQRR